MNRQRFPREFLISELKRVARLVGSVPTMDDFRRESKVAPETLVKRFGSWRKALCSAGFNPVGSRLTYHDSELIDELRRVKTNLGRTPSTTEFDELSHMSSGTLSQRLGGTWASACRAAKLVPFRATHSPPVVAGWNKGQRKLQITPDELRYLYETEGLSATAIGVRLGASRGTVLRRMSEFGIPTKRLHYTMPRETAIESLVYRELERRDVPFVRQQVIDGFWIADVLVPGAKIVVECDGEYWHSKPEMIKRDRKKDAYLKSRGYRVFRFPEAAIHADVGACIERIVKALVETYK
jgi:very-short-patch-repair endonuclease